MALSGSASILASAPKGEARVLRATAGSGARLGSAGASAGVSAGASAGAAAGPSSASSSSLAPYPLGICTPGWGRAVNGEYAGILLRSGDGGTTGGCASPSPSFSALSLPASPDASSAFSVPSGSAISSAVAGAGPPKGDARNGEGLALILSCFLALSLKPLGAFGFLAAPVTDRGAKGFVGCAAAPPKPFGANGFTAGAA
mmetsp:Transcript_12894/g.22822  ORF Transcript_12894/g.22822 Transcript_12894/m.22822 type:complete len:201 (-) Transcript_12894:27-629(-)